MEGSRVWRVVVTRQEKVFAKPVCIKIVILSPTKRNAMLLIFLGWGFALVLKILVTGIENLNRYATSEGLKKWTPKEPKPFIFFILLVSVGWRETLRGWKGNKRELEIRVVEGKWKKILNRHFLPAFLSFFLPLLLSSFSLSSFFLSFLLSYFRASHFFLSFILF